MYEHEKVPPPKGISDVPRYLRELLGGFFSRFAYIVKLVWQTGHWILFLLTFVALFKGITPVLGAIISQGILNELQVIIKQGGAALNSFWTSNVFFLLIFFFVYRILQQVINNVSRAVNRIAGEKVVKQVRLQMMEKSKELDLASFDDHVFYEKMENASREAGVRPLNIISETFNVVSTVIEFISYLVILLSAPSLAPATLAVIALAIPSAVINFVYRKKNFKYLRNRAKERRQMNYFADLLVNKDIIKEVRLFDLGDMFIGRFIDVFNVYYKGLRRLILSESLWHIAIGVLSGLVNLMFYAIIAMQVFTGKIMIGDYSLYTGAVAAIATCVNTLVSSSGTIYEGTLFIDNLISFMKEEMTVMPSVNPPRKAERKSGHTIEFKNVSFSYPGTERRVVNDVSFTIHSGETVAIVGLNGAGKTTLIKLLMRLYDPTEGCILLDGHDIREYDLGELYGMFGTIFQDFGKYALNVEENIRLGNIHREADIEAVKDAAEQSAAGEYIDKLPDGYSTPLMRIFEQNGIELSIGQWQKLAIARAFYADSEILILDEPTASLDPIAEQEIFNQFDNLRSDKTTIFVSHRLSSATIASQIFVLEDGRLIEKGSHTELMAQGGKYYKLFSTQARRYLAEKEDLAEAEL